MPLLFLLHTLPVVASFDVFDQFAWLFPRETASSWDCPNPVNSLTC
jgi:hypothetical protein